MSDNGAPGTPFELLGSLEGSRLVANLMHFGRILRAAGLPIGTGKVLDAVGADADNLVVLTGDFHSAAVADLRADPFDPSLPVVGSELMASSISSSFCRAKNLMINSTRRSWLDSGHCTFTRFCV